MDYTSFKNILDRANDSGYAVEWGSDYLWIRATPGGTKLERYSFSNDALRELAMSMGYTRISSTGAIYPIYEDALSRAFTIYNTAVEPTPIDPAASPAYNPILADMPLDQVSQISQEVIQGNYANVPVTPGMILMNPATSQLAANTATMDQPGGSAPWLWILGGYAIWRFLKI